MRRSDMKPKKPEGQRIAERKVYDEAREYARSPYLLISAREAHHVLTKGEVPASMFGLQ
jgi:hypothetical protein